MSQAASHPPNEPWYLGYRTSIADPVLKHRLRQFADDLPSELRGGLVFDLVTHSKRLKEALEGVPPHVRQAVEDALRTPPSLEEARRALADVGREEAAAKLTEAQMVGGEFELGRLASSVNLPKPTTNPPVPALAPAKPETADKTETTDRPETADNNEQDNLPTILLSGVQLEHRLRRIEDQLATTKTLLWVAIASAVAATAGFWMGASL